MKQIIAALIMIFSCIAVFSQEVIELVPSEQQEGPVTLEPSEPTREVVSVKTRSYQDIETLWAHFLDQADREQWSLALETLGRLKQLQKEMDIITLPELSFPLVAKGAELLHKKETELAIQCFSSAIEIDPSNLDAYLGIAKAYFDKGPAGISKGSIFFLKSFKGRLITIFSSIQLIIDAAEKLFFIIFFVSLAFGIVLLIKYARLFLHDIQELANSRFHHQKVSYVGVILLFIPGFLFIGWAWMFIYWLVLFWKYCARNEKFIIALLLIGIFLWTPFLKFADKIQRACLDPEISAYHGALFEKLNPNTLKSLQQEIVKNEENSRATLLLASLLRKKGDFDGAISLYNRILDKNDQHVEALNNLANTYYQLDMQDNAAKNYEKAIELKPDDATIIYNYSVAVRSQFNFTKADDLMKRAQVLDLNLILSYEARPPDKKGVVEFTLTPSDLVWLILEKTPYYKNPLAAILLFINNSTIILGIMLLLLRMKGKKLYYAEKCSSCGIAYCKRCQPVEKHHKYCSQCLHLFIKKDGVAQASKREKIVYIEKQRKKQQAISYILSILAPGSGSIYSESVFSGVAALIVWAFLLSMTFTHYWSIQPDIHKEFTIWLSFCALIGLVVYYFAYNIGYLLKPRKSS